MWIGIVLVASAVLTALVGPIAGVASALVVGWLLAVGWSRHRVRSRGRRWERTLDGLETERLRLRRFAPDDLDALRATVDDRVIAANGMVDDGAAELPDMRRPAWRTRKFDRVLVTDRHSGEVLGQLSFSPVAGGVAACSLGWWIGPTTRGRGYCTEAVSAAVRGLLAEGGVRAVLSGTNVENAAARRILEKTGAALVGPVVPTKLPDGSVIPGVWYVYSAG